MVVKKRFVSSAEFLNSSLLFSTPPGSDKPRKLYVTCRGDITVSVDSIFRSRARLSAISALNFHGLLSRRGRREEPQTKTYQGRSDQTIRISAGDPWSMMQVVGQFELGRRRWLISAWAGAKQTQDPLPMMHIF